jgi:hypothetical protein
MLIEKNKCELVVSMMSYLVNYSQIFEIFLIPHMVHFNPTRHSGGMDLLR